MIDVQKEYEQDLLDTQIIWEQQEELRRRAYMEQQEQLRQEMLRQQEINEQIVRENARQFVNQMPSAHDVTAVSLNGNVDNTFAGNAIPYEPIVPTQVFDSQARQMATAMGGFGGRKVLLVNTVCGTGSVGRLVAGLYHTLEEHGYECLVAYGRGEAPSDIRAYRIGTDTDVYIHGAMSRLYDRHGFYSRRATQDFVSMIKWSFTGHCSHFEYIGCMKWQSGCFKCEQLKEYPKSFGMDSSIQNYKDKKDLFTGIGDLTIVTPSEWLKDKVQQSFLREYPVVVVPTGIDLTQFYPYTETLTDDNLIYRIKNRLSLRNKTIILGVANPWRERKGLLQFHLLAKTLSDRYAIILVGLNDKQIADLPDGVTGLSRTDSPEELAALYSMADVYVNLTLEDTFPTTNLEALACGTPVVTYKAGGSPESIDETCGETVDRNSVQGVVAAIEKIMSSKGENYTVEKCLRRAQLYSKEYRFLEYIQLVYEAF